MSIASGDGPSEIPDERFFIKRIGKDLSKTGGMLRDEEERVFSTERWSVDKSPEAVNFYYRDYHRLCRGEELVSKRILFSSTYSTNRE